MRVPAPRPIQDPPFARVPPSKPPSKPRNPKPAKPRDVTEAELDVARGAAHRALEHWARCRRNVMMSGEDHVADSAYIEATDDLYVKQDRYELLRKLWVDQSIARGDIG